MSMYFEKPVPPPWLQLVQEARLAVERAGEQRRLELEQFNRNCLENLESRLFPRNERR
jgi:hypothetical protein